MDTKKCTKCKEVKPLEDYNTSKRRKDGRVSDCKLCRKRDRLKNKDRIKQVKARHYQANKEIVKAKRKEYYKINRDLILKSQKTYNEKTQKERKAYKKKYYSENKLNINDKCKYYYQINQLEIIERQKEYNRNNRESINSRIRERRTNDPLFRLTNNLRKRTWESFKYKNINKNSRTHEMLGIEWKDLKVYIEAMFTDGMTWDNYGEWHIDHIYPLSKAKDEKHLKELCHYSNLQPLWAEDNMSKGDKIL